MKIANPAPWGDQRPAVPEGYTITAIATGLGIPRQTLVLPNGDILVAEGRGGGAPKLTPKDFIAGDHQGKGHEPGEERQPPDPAARRRRRRRLRRPHRLRRQAQRALRARAGRQPALRRQPGCAACASTTAGPDQGERPAGQGHRPAVGDQPSLDQVAGGEPGRPLPLRRHRLQQQHHRARHGRRDRPRDGLAGGRRDRRAPALRDRRFATRPRSPSSPARASSGRRSTSATRSGRTWCPDYVTSVREGGFYGWPYSYWGQHVDTRVRPQDPEKVASAIRPDYALGSHVAALGLAFSTPAMGAALRRRACSSASTAAGTAARRPATR